MGTRSNYRVISERKDANGNVKQEKLVNVYVQYDGYPDGHPLDTAKWVSTGKVVNGISSSDSGLIFNGAGCLAAQLVERLKDGAGGTYINSLESVGMCGEEYIYDIIVNSDNMSIKLIAYENTTQYNATAASMETLFEGSPEEYIQYFSNLQ